MEEILSTPQWVQDAVFGFVPVPQEELNQALAWLEVVKRDRWNSLSEAEKQLINLYLNEIEEKVK